MGRRVRGRVGAGLLAAALLLAGCGGDDTTGPAGSGSPETTTSTTAASTTTSTTTTSTTTASTTVTEPAGALPDSEETGRSELEDGRHHGLWVTFEIGDTIAYGEFDLALFLTGAEAEAAAAARGEEVSNDYLVVNDDPLLRTLLVRGDARVSVATGGEPTLSPSNVADFAVERNPGSGFWVTVEDGLVTAIEEQWVP